MIFATQSRTRFSKRTRRHSGLLATGGPGGRSTAARHPFTYATVTDP
jgi:hypothetical protein